MREALAALVGTQAFFETPSRRFSAHSFSPIRIERTKPVNNSRSESR
jgi:hypothetical protein